MFVKIWVSMLYCRYYADFVSASLFNQITMFIVTSITALWTFYLVLSKSFSNCEIVLVVIVQLLNDVIHQVDY